MNSSNDAIVKHIRRALETGDVSLFIGAGLSKGAGLPDWAGLIKTLAGEMGVEWQRQPADVDSAYLLEMAQKCVTRAGGNKHRLLTVVRGVLDDPCVKPSEIQRSLHRLNCSRIFTTNFDSLIEYAYRDENKAIHVVDTDVQFCYISQDKPTLYKINGDIRTLTNICLTSDDFYNYWESKKEFVSAVENAMKESHMLYLGYSLSDPFFWEIWCPLVSRLGGSIKPGWAVFFDLDGDKQQYLKGKHITPILLGHEGDYNERMKAFLREIESVEITSSRVYSEPKSANNPEITIDSVAASARSALDEGLDSPLRWFENWDGTIYRPPYPPTHSLLNSCFVDTGIRNKIKGKLKAGKTAGITGFIGMGGVGKTYTAMRVAWDLMIEDEWTICWVSLLQRSTSDVLDLIAENFGLRFCKAIGCPEKVAALQRLMPLARAKWHRLLIVLDNAEHFPEFGQVLQALPQQAVLVTSRTREQVSIVSYFEIKPLNDESALEFCREFLKERVVDAGSDWLPDAEDQKDLLHLVRQLGGHPLSMRTVLTGFLRLPTSKRTQSRPFAYILRMLKEKGLHEFCTQQSDVYSADERSESILRTNVFATFRWLFDGLIQPDANETQCLAYYLLPIAAIVGTEGFTAEQVEKGVAALVEIYGSNVGSSRFSAMPLRIDHQESFLDDSDVQRNEEAFVGDQPVWLVTLKNAQGNRGLIEAALDCLEDIALVQYASAGSTFSMHPFIREFALGLEDERQISFPAAETLLRTGITICGENTRSDALFDLLPRLKGNRQLIEQAAGLLKQRWHGDLYYSPQSCDWKYLRAWAEEMLNLTADMGLHTTRAWVQHHLGELLDRMGYEDGLPMILDGFRSANANQEMKLADQIPQWENFSFEAAINLCTKSGDDSIWFALYLLTEKFDVDSEFKFREFYSLIRKKIAEEGSGSALARSLGTLFNSDMSAQGRVAACAGGFDANFSNNYIRIGALFHRFALFLSDREAVDRAEQLFSEISLIGLASPFSELDKKVRPDISPQHWLSTQLHHAGYELLTGGAIEEFTTSVDSLRQLALAQGIRAFWLEAMSAQYRGYWYFEKRDWSSASACFKSAQSAISHMAHKRYSDRWAKIIHCLLIASSTLESRVANPADLPMLLEWSSMGSNSIDLSYEASCHLALACIYWASDCLSSCIDAANRVVALFNAEFGGTPKFVLSIIQPWITGTPCINGKSDFPLHINWTKLPQRVRHSATNRTMKLVFPGMEFRSSGKDEMCIWPFYIDEEPLTITDLARWGAKAGVEVFGNGASGEYIRGQSKDALTRFLIDTNTLLPTEREIFSAWLQGPGERKPEMWLDHSQANLEELIRIENNLLTGETRGRNWSEVLPIASKKQFGRLHAGYSEIEDETSERDDEEIAADVVAYMERHNSFAWVTEIPNISIRFQAMLAEKFYCSKEMSESEARELGVML